MQGATENNMGIWAALQANTTVTVHSAGWLEGGLCFGYEKFINDVEALQTVAELCGATPEDEDSLAWSALEDVQPGGHFFATEHTMSRYKDAFYEPLVADLNNFGAWSEGGAMTSSQRATSVWQQLLRDFEAPAHGEAVADRIAGYISDHKDNGGAPPAGG